MITHDPDVLSYLDLVFEITPRREGEPLPVAEEITELVGIQPDFTSSPAARAWGVGVRERSGSRDLSENIRWIAERVSDPDQLRDFSKRFDVALHATLAGGDGGALRLDPAEAALLQRLGITLRVRATGSEEAS